MGSGKTTVARILAEEFQLSLIEENFGDNAFLSRFYADMKRWAFHSQSFFLMEKITQMLETSKMLQSHSIVQDTPIQQDAFSYAKAQHVLGNIDDAEWKLYLKIYHAFEPYFPKPNLIVYLQTSVPELVKRIENRGRSYEQKVTQSYIELLDMLNNKWLSENTTIRVLTIPTDGVNVVTSKTAQQSVLDTVRKKLHI